MTEQTETAPAVDKKVADALKRQGVKVEDLTPEQRVRAAEAPEKKAGLRGKVLVTWVLDGLSSAEQVKTARKDREASQAGAKAGERKPGKRESAYPPEVREAVKLSNSIRGKSHGGGPKQHKHVREVVVAELGGQPQNGDALAALVGVKRAELTALADGSADREALKALRPLGEKMDAASKAAGNEPDPWVHGRHLAAALAAWAEQLDR